MKKPILCLVITRLVAGGAQRVFLDLAEHFRQDAEVHLVAGPETGKEGSFWDQARLLLPASQIHLCPWLIRQAAPLRDILAIAYLRRLFRKIKPDIVHTHTSKAGVLGRLAAKAAGVSRVIHSTHGLIYDADAQIPGVSGRQILKKIFLAMERKAGYCTHHLICLSEREVGDALRLQLVRSNAISCIANGIPLQEFEAIERRQQDWDLQPFRIGTAGRLNLEKGHALLINSFRRLLDKFPYLELEIAGDGPLKAQLQAHCVQLGIQNRVHFPGFIKDMPAFLKRIQLFVLSSHYEGFGLVLVEAMAAGLPVVATDVGGVSEVLDDGKAGVVVPPGSEPELMMGLEYLLNNRHLCYAMGQVGRKRAIDLYSLRHMVDAHRHIYWPDVKKDSRYRVPANWVPVDLHMHSEYSFDSHTPVVDILVHVREMGLKAIAITDHDEVEGSRLAVAHSPKSLFVIPAVEVTTDAGDIIGLFIKDPVPKGSWLEAVENIKAQGGIVYLPHPFRGRRGISLDLLRRVDVVEIYNGRSQGTNHDGEQNFGDSEIVAFAKEHGKTGVGASDAHHLEEIGRVQTFIPPFSSEAELRQILLSGRIYPVLKNGEWVSCTLPPD